MTVAHNAGSGLERAIARSVDFELTIADLARRSERRAWTVATIALAMAVALLGGYFYLLPLKEKVPYLVMADAYTGTSTVARLAGNFNDNTITASEAVNRSNVAHFILARECSTRPRGCSAAGFIPVWAPCFRSRCSASW